MILEKQQIVLNVTEVITKEQLQQGTYLCLFGIDKIPPHLGIIAEGKYYSSNAKGNRVGESLDGIWRRVNQGAIKTVFIQISISFDMVYLKKAFLAYPKLEKDQTCLLPIKDFLIASGYDVEEANFVFELIPILERMELIRNSYTAQNYSDEVILPTYTKEDIQNRIVKLQETC